MSKQQKRPNYSPEVRERAIRMVGEHARDYPSQWAAIVSIAAKIGCSAQTLHTWVRQAVSEVEKAGLRKLEEGQRISFGVNGDAPGPKAVSIKLLS